MTDKKLFLIDATAFCYRAFYALGGLSTSFGQPTNAIYGFLNMLNKILKKNKPDYLAVCFDVSRDTFRQKKFVEYKINRPPMPDGLSSQIPFIKDIVKAYGMTSVEKKGFEADDIIASLSRKAKQKNIPVVIVSSDKDILQLVDDNIEVFSPYKDSGTTYDVKKVHERFGITPDKIPDVIALMGDDVDNIPGVPGIGEKTAVTLIKKFGSAKDLLKKTGQLGTERIKQAVLENADKIKLNHELALLDSNVDLDLKLDDLKIKEQDSKELFRIFKYLEFKKFLKEIPLETKEPHSDIEVAALADEELKDAVGPHEELFLYGSGISDLVLYARERFWRMASLGKNIKEILQDKSIKKTGHDLKLIKLALAKDNYVLDGLHFDTMIAAYLINPSKGSYDLPGVVLDYLEKGGFLSSFDNAAALDFIVQLKPKLGKTLNEMSLTRLFNDVEMPLVGILADMEQEGIKLDLKVLNELSIVLEKRLVHLMHEIYKISGEEFNINSPKQLRVILFDKLKLRVVKKTKTGPSTDEEVLTVLAASHELPALLLEYRQLLKLKNTYVDTLPQMADTKTSRIHTSFNQTGTETGRLSSANPNLQNIPAKTDIGSQIRRSIVSSGESSYLLSCDYSQVELRILAHLSGDKSLIRAFKDGKDIHRATASLIYSVDEKNVTEPMREVAKRINFGIVYGLSAWGLSRDLKIPVEEAQSFIDAYFTRYPQVKTYIEGQIKKAGEDGFVTTILGRRRYLPEIKSSNQAIRQLAERQAVNTPIQGSASDLIKLAMVDISGQIRKNSLQSRMLLQIHDELVFDVPENELGIFSGSVKNIMENVLKLDLPIKVSAKKGKNWLEMEDMV